MGDCVFCKIVKGDLPSYKIYEDKKVLAFLDINPVRHGHALIIPKKHYETLEDIPEKELNLVIGAVKKVGKALKDGLGVKGYNVNSNNGAVAGQIVPHVHFHIIPRMEGDRLGLWPGGRYGMNEAEEVLEKIKIK